MLLVCERRWVVGSRIHIYRLTIQSRIELLVVRWFAKILLNYTILVGGRRFLKLISFFNELLVILLLWVIRQTLSRLLLRRQLMNTHFRHKWLVLFRRLRLVLLQSFLRQTYLVVSVKMVNFVILNHVLVKMIVSSVWHLMIIKWIENIFVVTII